MKKIAFFLVAVLVSGFGIHAKAISVTPNPSTNFDTRGYGKSFIFVETGVEFSIFPDGQFDFYMSQHGPNTQVALNTPDVSISFNSGFNYNGFIQYDEFGAIIQIKNIPIYYDYYGRVSQIGNVRMRYNSFGYVSRVGSLYVHYNRYNQFTYCTGFINPFNRVYVYRPWHRFYRVPAFNHCVVYSSPYRQNYRPVRYRYTTPYTNNYRRTTAVASRRGNTISRRQDLATRTTNRRGNSQTVQKTRTRRNAVASRNRTMTSRNNGTRKVVKTNRTRNNNRQVTAYNATRKKSTSTRNVNRNSSVNKKNTGIRKPNTTKPRTYNKERKTTSNSRTSNSSRRK